MKKTLTLCAALALFGVMSLVSMVFPPPQTASAAVPLQVLQGSETKDWASLADGVGASEDVDVFGAAMGDTCLASQSVDVVDVTMTCNVTAANVATVHVQNESTATVDLASSTLRVLVFKRPSTGG